MAPSIIPPLMSSDEVNLLVYAYLAESSLDHSAFTLYSESRLSDFLKGSPDTTNDPAANGAKEVAPSIPPSGHLIRILQKGLLYLQAEARFRGEDVSSNPPRLIGYDIPDTLPIPPLPKTVPPPSPPSLPSNLANGKVKKVTERPASSTQAISSSPHMITQTSSLAASSDAPAASGVKRKDPATAKASTSKDNNDLPQPPQSKKARLVGASDKFQASDSQEEAATNNSPNNTNNASEAAAAAGRARKGKLRADVRDDGEMSDAFATPGEKTVAAGTENTVQAGTTSSGDKGAAPNSASSTSAADNKTSTSAIPASSVSTTDAQLSKGRRSTSPIVNRASASSGVAASRNRPRSTSPVTTFRASSASLRAVSGSGPAQTPTLDASGMPAVSTYKQGDLASISPKDIPRQKVKHTIGRDQATFLKGHTMPVQPCSWNPKVPGLLATGSGDSTARIWDVPTSPSSRSPEPITCKHASGQRRCDVTAVEWNEEGSLLATATEEGIARIWTPSGDLHLVLSMHQRTILCVKWNAKGTMLLTGGLDHTICLWELTYGKVKQQWTSHSDTILDLDWLSDDVFASCSIDKNIHIHQVGRPSPAYRFKGHSDEVNCIRFDPNRRLLASGSDDNSVRIWSLRPVKPLLGMSDDSSTKDNPSPKHEEEDGEPQEPLCLVLKGHKKEIHAIAWAPRSERPEQPKVLASASFDNTVRLWDARNGTCLHVVNRHTDMVYSLVFQPGTGDFLATGSNDHSMCITRIPNSDKLASASGEDYEVVAEYIHPGPVYEITWHPSRSQIAVCGKPDVVHVVNINDVV